MINGPTKTNTRSTIRSAVKLRKMRLHIRLRQTANLVWPGWPDGICPISCTVLLFFVIGVYMVTT